MEKVYKFKPLLKTLIWGTESWQLSGVEGSETTCPEGSLNQLVSKYGAALVGRDNWERHGAEFPLLIKFIDAHQNLSIQVHPDDETARRQGKKRGKTEMWYVLESDPQAYLYNGIRVAMTPEEYKQRVASDSIVEALARYDVSEGDCFFIPAGRIHAIGTGCHLVEIQQTSDVTYRIYDYGRRDAQGHLRQLHTREAAESIDFHVEDDYRQPYEPKKNEGVELVRCPYFITSVYDMTEPMEIDYTELDSFVCLIGMKGAAQLNVDGQQVDFHEGETLLLPANISHVRVEGTIKFLETYC